ncbi:hypothetical protein GCM10022198_00730 [Klugiella xanthotipulae]|uniref:Uncharacterized protein n=1 Tax=Klugiella xanthotipulae TaxID=244735 RepID=A0A543I5E2_9MICO|nr:hypothetical protein [Klugiella xanthotipulae]TQM65788.1 hypothetical protein FB466_0600 [Klugiella xanthotipulae]
MAESRDTELRRYATVLVGMVTILLGAVIIPAWGFTALLSDSDPISSDDISAAAGPLMIVSALAVMALCLTVVGSGIRAGTHTFPWLLALFTGVGAYLLAAMIGIIFTLPPEETFASLYLLWFIPLGFLGAVTYWAILARHAFTDRTRPRWPWENPEDE